MSNTSAFETPTIWNSNCLECYLGFWMFGAIPISASLYVSGQDSHGFLKQMPKPGFCLLVRLMASNFQGSDSAQC